MFPAFPCFVGWDGGERLCFWVPVAWLQGLIHSSKCLVKMSATVWIALLQLISTSVT
jgi:hypothetical protein